MRDGGTGRPRGGYALFDSPIGRFGLAWSDAGIVRVQLPEATPAATAARLDADGRRFEAPPPPAIRRVAQRLQRHLAGKVQDLSDVPLDTSALAPFRQQVYAAARAVPAGRTATYGELARAIDTPAAARAIGRALGVNPFPIVVPCHRVLAANGRPGGFSAFGGLDTKERLLALEGVRLGAAVEPRVKAAPRGGGSGLGLEAAVRHLRTVDPKLRTLIDRVGPCTIELKRTQSTFAALAEAIVYQQLHGKAAATIFGRFRALYPGARFPEPAEVLATPEADLRAVGLSRNKLAAIRDLAEKVASGVVPDVGALRRMSDEDIVQRLTTVRGIGRWTVEMLLIFRLGRPDVLPVDDYGVRKGATILLGKKEMLKPAELARHGERWRPHRSVASWYMWRAADPGGAA